MPKRPISNLTSCTVFKISSWSSWGLRGLTHSGEFDWSLRHRSRLHYRLSGSWEEDQCFSDPPARHETWWIICIHSILTLILLRVRSQYSQHSFYYLRKVFWTNGWRTAIVINPELLSDSKVSKQLKAISRKQTGLYTIKDKGFSYKFKATNL